MNNINLFNDDCRIGLSELLENSLDLTITSPPYNVGLEYEEYDDTIERQEYLEFLKEVFTLIYDKSKDDGRLCINNANSLNGSDQIAFQVNNLMLDIGWKPYTFIVWDKNQTHNRTAWGSFMSASSPSFPTTFEFIWVYYKENKKKLLKGTSTIKKQEFIDWSLPMWRFAPETRLIPKYEHKAMFPEELPYRLIQMFSYDSDLVCDPFSGIGTTAVVCKKNNRGFIGWELTKKYFENAIQRIKETEINQSWIGV